MDRNDRGVMGYLIERGANPNSITNGNPVLHFAILANDEALVKTALDHGADPHILDGKGRNMLHLAAERRCRTAVYELKEVVDVNSVDLDGNNSLMYAVTKPDVCTVQWLCSKGADVNKTNKDGDTAMHIAIDYIVKFHTCISIIDWLFDHRPDPNIKNNAGLTPLQVALNHYKEIQTDPLSQIIYKLLRYWLLKMDEGSESALPIWFDQTDLTIGSVQKRVGEYPKLLNARDHAGCTVLHHAVRTGIVATSISSKKRWFKIIKYLLEKGSFVNAIDNDGNTPLHCSSLPLNILNLILSFGGRIDIQNSKGETPLHVVLQAVRPKLETVKALLEAGADTNALNNSGETPFHVLCSKTLTVTRVETFKFMLLHSFLENYTKTKPHPHNVGLWKNKKNWPKHARNSIDCKEYDREIQRMKNINIGENVSLYDFVMSENWGVSLAPKVVKKVNAGRFPVFGEIIIQKLALKVKKCMTDHRSHLAMSFCNFLNQHPPMTLSFDTFLAISKKTSNSDFLNLFIACVCTSDGS
ncbi:hypothetical protein JTE90_021733 [Oedothorax gibbosus]|uniref:Uncharacterized protein n=1 Tax=Oedothorax gibbosus TaxID=931172 RepID=A0AAV6UDV6_9ARAC|nr:hypothetical protein JTE90_021733 [Oedothorax gibbosus]